MANNHCWTFPSAGCLVLFKTLVNKFLSSDPMATSFANWFVCCNQTFSDYLAHAHCCLFVTYQKTIKHYPVHANGCRDSILPTFPCLQSAHLYWIIWLVRREYWRLLEFCHICLFANIQVELAESKEMNRQGSTSSKAARVRNGHSLTLAVFHDCFIRISFRNLKKVSFLHPNVNSVFHSFQTASLYILATFHDEVLNDNKRGKFVAMKEIPLVHDWLGSTTI